MNTVFSFNIFFRLSLLWRLLGPLGKWGRELWRVPSLILGTVSLTLSQWYVTQLWGIFMIRWNLHE